MTVTTLGPPQDRQLACRFAEQAEPLFEVLGRGARRLTRNAADAEDLLQDTLLHAYAGFASFQEGSNLKAWLFRILYNRWVSGHRARQRRVVEVSADALTDLVEGRGAMCSAETTILDVLPRDDVRAAMAAMPDGFREALFYADIEGYTYAETAAILGIPMGTAMSRVARARKRLRIALAHLDHSSTDTSESAIA
ncbi:sigma-70 family RNA polymerase sigma factor [Mycolicibacterium phlei]|jgi:RNA polymerase sigma factor (sigma-70 family)